MHKIIKQDINKIVSAYNTLTSIKRDHEALQRTLENQLQDIVSAFNAKNKAVLEKMQEDYLSANSDLTEISNAIHSKMENYISDRSDKWHDSESGDKYTIWAEEWGHFAKELESFAYHEFELEIESLATFDLPDLPEMKS